MKNIKALFVLLAMIMFSGQWSMVGAREVTSLNQEWQFRKGTFGVWGVYPNIYVPKGEKVVNLPHTYNDEDFMSDGGYYRGEGSYMKEIDVPESWKGKRIFVKFEGAGSVANVQVNWVQVGEHKGAYNAFTFELTDYLTYGQKNYLLVTCDNSHRFDVATLSGDFNVYGGLYRDAWLIITDDVAISPLYFGSDGLQVTQKMLTADRAEVSAEIRLTSKMGYQDCEVEFQMVDAKGQMVVSKTTNIINNDKVTINAGVSNPHLWDGMADPYLYKVVAILKKGGKEIDRVEDQFGFRNFYVDENKGFFLNGKHLKLRGVSRHQDWAGIASALTKENHITDLNIIQEMGVNALRLAHYPQAHFMFEEADRRGFVVWEEIPFITGYNAYKEFEDNLRLQLKEMIIQNYNHPSIMFWGIFNEVPGGHNSIAAELSDIAHELDLVRLTTSATCFEGDFNFITDVMGWNKYFGWYDGKIDDFGPFFDKWHQTYPNAKISISEYGAGASINQHVGKFDENNKEYNNPRGKLHPEEKQTVSHMKHIKMITERDYIWGSYVWNMFDFASSMRTEGDTNNINDKGLVTHDRQTRKDAFYLYKANWNKAEQTVHLCSKRYVDRKEDVTDIIVFTTAPNVKLYINGKLVGTQKTDAYATVVWENVKLSKGVNQVEVRTAHGNDSATWNVL